jgi:hypothetical protein
MSNTYFNRITELEMKDNSMDIYSVNVSIFQHMAKVITNKNEVNHKIKR